MPDEATLKRTDVYLRIGDAPAPVSNRDLVLDDEFLGWEAQAQDAQARRRPERAARARRAARRTGAFRSPILSRARKRAARRAIRSPIPSAAICKARNSSRSRASSTRRRRKPAWDAKSRPSGSFRTSATRARPISRYRMRSRFLICRAFLRRTARAASPPIIEWRAKRAGHFGGKRFGINQS